LRNNYVCRHGRHLGLDALELGLEIPVLYNMFGGSDVEGGLGEGVGEGVGESGSCWK
jgi:hypothetical protein